MKKINNNKYTIWFNNQIQVNVIEQKKGEYVCKFANPEVTDLSIEIADKFLQIANTPTKLNPLCASLQKIFNAKIINIS